MSATGGGRRAPSKERQGAVYAGLIDRAADIQERLWDSEALRALSS